MPLIAALIILILITLAACFPKRAAVQDVEIQVEQPSTVYTEPLWHE